MEAKSGRKRGNDLKIMIRPSLTSLNHHLWLITPPEEGL